MGRDADQKRSRRVIFPMQEQQPVSEPLPPSEPLMVSMALRLSVGFLYLVSVAYMSVYLYKAASVDSLSEGFQKISENPWATSALVDYLTFVLDTH